MEIAKLSTKGQLVVPNKIRRQIGLKDGDFVAVETFEDLVIIKRIDSNIPKEVLEKIKNRFISMEQLLYPRK